MGFDAAMARLNDLGAAALALLPGLLLGLPAFGLFLLLARALRAGVVRAAPARGVAPGFGIVLGRIGSGFCLLVGGLVAAAIAFPSISAAGLFGVLGIGGVAIGFAFRDILQNALAGVLILLTRPFRIGDQVVAGGYEGTVEDIQVRATAIRTYDNRRAVIPNTALFTDKVLVNTAFDKRRLSVRVGDGNDIAEARRVIEAATRGAEGVLADPPPRALAAELGDSAVLLDVFFWIDPPRHGEAIEVTDRVLARVKPALTGAGIDIPYPTMQVLLHDQTDATDGDRAHQREGWPARGDGQDPPPRWRVVRDGEGVRPPRADGAAGRVS
jgi:small conductance mechanosensitive channel